MKTTTLLGVLAVLDSCCTFSAIAYTYTDHKADNSIEAWIASVGNQASGWQNLLDTQHKGALHIAAWGNTRGWANGGGGGSANR